MSGLALVEGQECLVRLSLRDQTLNTLIASIADFDCCIDETGVVLQHLILLN